jgi:hypothetical protein
VTNPIKPVQVYKNKDFPMGLARQEFTTIPDFLVTIDPRLTTHVIVDPSTYEHLGRNYEEIQDRTLLATAAQKAEGFLCRIDSNIYVFTDAFLPRERQWVNADHMSRGGRSQYIIVHHTRMKPYQASARTA